MHNHTRAWLLVTLIALTISAPALAQSTGGSPTVESLEYAGDGTVAGTDAERDLWQSAAHEFGATVGTDGSEGVEREVCLVAAASDGGERWNLTCQSVAVPANDTTTVEVAVEEWPANATGAQTVQAGFVDGNGTAIGERASLSVTVIREDGDLDEDGLSNERESSLETDLRRADSDGDGLPDGAEVDTHDTSPRNADTDGDGLEDGAEVETHGTDPTSADTDDDGLADRQELDHGTNPTERDSDGDGVADGAEVNVHETDPTEPDTDGDGLDDGAEIEKYETNPLAADTDDDGLTDALEAHTYESDPTSVDTDDDGIDDGTEVNEYQTDPTVADSDYDNLADGAEVNTYGTDPTDPDTDGDGLADGAEVQRFDTDPTAVDSDGDGQPDGAEVDDGLLSTIPFPLGVGTVLALGFVAWFLAYRRGFEPARRAARPVVWLRGRLPGRTGAARAARDPRAARSEAAETGEPGSRTGAPVGPERDRGARGGADAADVPPELLPKDERVIALLEEREGRMPQADIVEETGWSKSTVSRVLTEMAEEDRVVKIDVGAGNVIALPEAVPSGVGSPFDG